MKNDTMKCYLNIDYSIRPKKRFIQTLLYNLSKVRGNVLMLCGPALKEHLDDAKVIMINNGKCIIFENDAKTFYQNAKALSTSKAYSKVKLVYGNIINAKARRFIDLDFCRNLDSNLYIVKKLFNKMNKVGLNKHILITFSNRGANREKDLDNLCKLFNIPNKFTKDALFKGIKKYDNKVVNATYISYRDGMPMTTFSYQWK